MPTTLINDGMFGIDESLGILTSMITPAVLILACGSLILTTSNRLSRVIDRVRKISPEFMQLAKLSDTTTSVDEASLETDARTILYRILLRNVRRSRLLTHALTIFYLSLGIFVATSLAIGIVSLTHIRFAWVPTVLGMIGAVLLFVGSTLLIIESRLTFLAIADEMDYVINTARTKAPALAAGANEKKIWRKWLDTILPKRDV